MTAPSSNAVLSGIALVGMIGLAAALIFFPVPSVNHDFIVAAFSSLATALTITGGSKIADKLTTSTGDNPTIQPDGDGK